MNFHNYYVYLDVHRDDVVAGPGGNPGKDTGEDQARHVGSEREAPAHLEL